MPWQRIRAQDGIFDVNWDGVHSLLRSWACAQAMSHAARKNTEKVTFGPDICTVEVDWKAARAQTDKVSENLYQKAKLAAKSSLGPLALDLKHKVYQTAHNRQYVLNLMRSAHDETMKNVEASVHKGELGVHYATMIRNLAAGTLLFVGGIGEIGAAGWATMTAGDALAVGGGGAALKGLSTYQDEGKGHAGHAAAIFAANMVAVAVPLGQAKTTAKIADEGMKLFAKFCFVKLDAAVAGITTLVEGGHVDTAMLTGAGHVVVNSHAEIVDHILESLDLDKAVLPAKVFFKVLEAASDKLAERLTEEKKTPSPPAPPPKSISREHRIMDSAAVESHMVEKLAIRRAR